MTVWQDGAGRLLASARQRVAVLVAVLTVMAALVACGAAEDPALDVTGGTTPGGTAVDYNEADVVFARAMIPHGEQGATMSELVLEQKSLPPALNTLAVELRDNRSTETDQLQAWVAERGEPVAADAPHDHGGGGDGIATPTQMDALDSATGAAAQALYVEMMTKHHRGAVAAAQDEIAHGKSPVLLEFAQMVIRTREAQLAVLLDDAAAVPATTPNPDATPR